MTSMYCYFCDQTSPEGALFCKPCGSPFHLAPCPRCAAVNDLKMVSCYKCKAILPIRRAETKETASNDVVAANRNAEPVIEQTLGESANESPSEVRALAVAAARELTQPAQVEELQAARVSASSAKIEEAAVVGSALPAALCDDADQKSGQPDHPLVELHDENYQKTIVLQRAAVDVHVDVREDGYQKTIPVRRPLEKVHDEDYQKTIALQRAPADALQAQRSGASQYPPVGGYEVNYQKTIALSRALDPALHPAPVDVHDEAYVKTISLRHPPASLAGGATPHVAADANSLSSAISADLQSERARLPIDLVQKAKWGQRALLASVALLAIVTVAYFFLRAEQSQVLSNANTDPEPAQLQTEALARISAVPVSKAIDPLPLNVPIDAAKQTQNKVAAKVVIQRQPAAPPPSLPAKQEVVPARVTQQTKAAPTGQVLYLPPGTTSPSAAATAAAIAEAIGKTPATQSVNPSNVPNAKAAPQTQAGVAAVESTRASEAATTKGTGNVGAVSSPPVPCTEALAALGLCVIQPASQPLPQPVSQPAPPKQ
jgi:hypothetical protein